MTPAREKIQFTANLVNAIQRFKLDPKPFLDHIKLILDDLDTDLSNKVPPSIIYKTVFRHIDKAQQDESKKIKKRVPCKKGCSFCCKMNVDISTVEAEIINEYCTQNNIPISKSYLERQLSYPVPEISLAPVSRCVFLTGFGECGIYEARPTMCRMHMVISDPKYCDTATYRGANGGVIIHFNYDVELYISALNTVFPKVGRMPQMLLPYAK